MNSTMIQRRDRDDKRQSQLWHKQGTQDKRHKEQREGQEDIRKGYESIENKGIEGNKRGGKKGWQMGIEKGNWMLKMKKENGNWLPGLRKGKGWQ